MRYYVVSQDGQRYGPADIATLNQWIQEGRLLPTNLLEDETSGQRMPASGVDGLNFPTAQPQAGPQQQTYAPGQPYQQHYGRGSFSGDDGSKDLNNAWIFAILSLVTCWCCGGILFGLLGMQAANRAIQKGNSAASTPRIISIVGLSIAALLTVAGVILRIVGFSMAGSGGFNP